MLLALLLLVLAALIGAAPAASAAPAPTPSPSASGGNWGQPPGTPQKIITNSNPCDGFAGAFKDVCQQSNPLICQPVNAKNQILCTYTYTGGASSSGDGGTGADCSVLQGTPAQFCQQGAASASGSSGGWLANLSGDCKSPPTPELPTDGILGELVTRPATPPAFVDPASANAQNHLYEEYGYAGLAWNTYDLGCGGALIRDQNAGIDTWAADKSFTMSKSAIALDNALRGWAASPTALKPMDPLVARASHAVGTAVYAPWITVSMLILGCGIIVGSRRRDLPGTVTAIAWALIVITCATISIQQPIATGSLADDAISSTIGQIDAQLANVPGQSDPGTAQADLTTSSILYRSWLRGELGDPDSATARTYGMLLLDSQALTWAQAEQPPATQAKIMNAKEAEFRGVAAAIQAADPDAYAHLTGHSSSRLGSSTMAFLAALVSSLFSMIGSVIEVLAKLIIRMVVVFFPLLALIGLHRRTSGVVRTGAGVIGAALINAPLFALLGGVEVLCVDSIMSSPSSQIADWAKILLLALITVVLWAVSRPFRKLTAMVSPNRNFIGEGIDGVTQARQRATRALLGRYSPQARMLRRMYRGGQPGDTRLAGADGIGGGVGGLPGFGAEEEPWEIPAGYTQPRPHTPVEIPQPRTGATPEAVSEAKPPKEPLVEAPYGATPPTVGPPQVSAPAAEVPESMGPVWPTDPAKATASARSAEAGAGNAPVPPEQAATTAAAPTASDAPTTGGGAVFRPHAPEQAAPAASGYHDRDGGPVHVWRPDTAPGQPATPTSTPPRPPVPPAGPLVPPPAAPEHGYLPEMESGDSIE